MRYKSVFSPLMPLPSFSSPSTMSTMASQASFSRMWPRFNDPDADLILRSSDNVDFAVASPVIRLISPFFKDMLSLPQPANKAASKYAVVHMSEDAATLLLLLRFCYPRTHCDEPRLVAIKDIKRVAMLAEKYDLDFMHRTIHDALVEYTNVCPLYAFVVAWRFDYRDALRYAARRTLYTPNFFQALADAEDPPELEEITGTALLHLYRFHSVALLQLRWILQADQGSDHPVDWLPLYEIEAVPVDAEPCFCDRVTLSIRDQATDIVTEQRIPSWWWTYVKITVNSVIHGSFEPSEDPAFEYAVYDIYRQSGCCARCSSTTVRVLKDTRHRLRSKIESVLDNVSL